jgi:hypothetical protein
MAKQERRRNKKEIQTDVVLFLLRLIFILVPFLKNNLVFERPPLNLPLAGGEDNFPPLPRGGLGCGHEFGRKNISENTILLS